MVRYLTALFIAASACSKPSFVSTAHQPNTDSRGDGQDVNGTVVASSDTTQGNGDQTNVPSDTTASIPIPAGDGTKELSLPLLVPMSVNAGASSKRYSELLDFKVMPDGGSGAITVAVMDSMGSPNIKVQGARVLWKPGYDDAAGYHSEVGNHVLHILATDEKGTQAETHVAVKVSPISWSVTSDDVKNEPIEMRTHIFVRESLHPKRTYSNVPTLNGVKLNAAACRSIAGQGDLMLEEEPVIGNTAKTIDGGTNVHETGMTLKLNRASQPSEKIALMTWINLVPAPTETISSKSDDATPVRILMVYTRCLGDDEAGQDVAKCEVATAAAGVGVFYYCSDYNVAEMHSYYCAASAKLGTRGDGC